MFYISKCSVDIIISYMEDYAIFCTTMDFTKLFEMSLDFADIKSTVVGGPAGPAMAGPLVLVGPCFWPNIFFAGPFSHVSYKPSLIIHFSLIKD